MKDGDKKAGALRALAALHHEECPVAKVLRAKADAMTTKGPAQVATPDYRANYESIFGAKQEVGQA